MHIAIIGASGFVGTKLVNEAIRRDHEITAICRHPEKIELDHEQVKAQKGDVFNPNELVNKLEGHDAVISAYNPGWEDPEIYDHYLEGCKVLQKAVKQSGVNRFLVVGGAGSLEIAPGEQLIDTPDFPEEYKEGAKAARDYLDILSEEDDLDWTFLSPAILMHPGIDTGRTGTYRIGTDQPVFDANGESKISAEDLAVALLDELENADFIQQRFTVAY